MEVSVNILFSSLKNYALLRIVVTYFYIRTCIIIASNKELNYTIRTRNWKSFISFRKNNIRLDWLSEACGVFLFLWNVMYFWESKNYFWYFFLFLFVLYLNFIFSGCCCTIFGWAFLFHIQKNVYDISILVIRIIKKRR